MIYRKCSNCGKIIEYDESDMIVRRCPSCGTNILGTIEYESLEQLNLHENEYMKTEIASTFSLLWKEKKVVIQIPDDGSEVFIGRKYQDCWRDNTVGGLNISREHLKIVYVDEDKVRVANLSRTNGTLVEGEDFDIVSPSGSIYLHENETITLDAIGPDGIELVIIKN